MREEVEWTDAKSKKNFYKIFHEKRNFLENAVELLLLENKKVDFAGVGIPRFPEYTSVVRKIGEEERREGRGGRAGYR